MDINEVLDVLKRLRIALVTSNVDGDRVFEPLGMGIEALEKQIPKKPIFEPDEGIAECIYCPSCKHDLMGGIESDAEDDPQHCWFCGQKLDWDNYA